MTHFSAAAWGTHWGLLILRFQRRHSELYMLISPTFSSFSFSFLFLLPIFLLFPPILGR